MVTKAALDERNLALCRLFAHQVPAGIEAARLALTLQVVEGGRLIGRGRSFQDGQPAICGGGTQPLELARIAEWVEMQVAQHQDGRCFLRPVQHGVEILRRCERCVDKEETNGTE